MPHLGTRACDGLCLLCCPCNLQIYQQFTSNAKMLGAPGGAGGAGGANAVAGILQLICSCLSPPAANQQQQQQYGAAPGAPASGTPANANTAPGSSYAAGPAAGVRLMHAAARGMGGMSEEPLPLHTADVASACCWYPG